MKIFKEADFVSRVCLALTAKTFYATYEKTFGSMPEQPVALRERVEWWEDGTKYRTCLGVLLCSWASTERELWYWWYGDRWMTAAKWIEVVNLCKITRLYPWAIYRTLEGMKG
jgi:hypothetical protein